MKKFLDEIRARFRQWWPKVEPAAVAAGIAVLLSVSGCVPGGMFMADPATMTPEQLQQYKGLGYDAIRCATVKGGPPVGGTVTSVTIPKERSATVKFNGCDVQSIEVGGPK